MQDVLDHFGPAVTSEDRLRLVTDYLSHRMGFRNSLDVSGRLPVPGSPLRQARSEGRGREGRLGSPPPYHRQHAHCWCASESSGPDTLGPLVFCSVPGCLLGVCSRCSPVCLQEHPWILPRCSSCHRDGWLCVGRNVFVCGTCEHSQSTAALRFAVRGLSELLCCRCDRAHGRDFKVVTRCPVLIDGLPCDHIICDDCRVGAHQRFGGHAHCPP